QLVADVAIDADRREPHPLVETYTGWIRQRNTSVGIDITLRRKNRAERQVQPMCDAHPPVRRIDIRRRVNGPLIGGADAMLRCISVTGSLPSGLVDEPW